MHFQPFSGVGQRVATPVTDKKINLVNLYKKTALLLSTLP